MTGKEGRVGGAASSVWNTSWAKQDIHSDLATAGNRHGLDDTSGAYRLLPASAPAVTPWWTSAGTPTINVRNVLVKRIKGDRPILEQPEADRILKRIVVGVDTDFTGGHIAESRESWALSELGTPARTGPAGLTGRENPALG